MDQTDWRLWIAVRLGRSPPPVHPDGRRENDAISFAVTRRIPFFGTMPPGKYEPFPAEDTQMCDLGDIWLCNFEEKRVSRTEITTSLVFDATRKRFRIRVSQDYETQDKIESRYSDADAYFANHPEYRDKARKAIKDHTAKNSKQVKRMKAALTRIKNL